jgi:tetratricopeptide (TPR) repeat protein
VTALREAGRTGEARDEVDAFLAETPGNAAALIQKGILHYLEGEKSRALGAWEEALYKDPLNKIVQVYLNTVDRENPQG